jgi:hypothetical protein
VGRRGAVINVQTGNAKVSGRGGTKQNLHWSEVAFYPNTEILSAEDLVTAAEQQVADGIGKIFRESTGNIAGDFFASEYERGKAGEGEFKSRFLSWWIHKEYSLTPPDDWRPTPDYKKLMDDNKASRDQCYWHFKKVLNSKNEAKIRREYPMDDTEAFLMGGDMYFNAEVIKMWHIGNIKKPITDKPIYV